MSYSTLDIIINHLKQGVNGLCNSEDFWKEHFISWIQMKLDAPLPI